MKRARLHTQGFTLIASLLMLLLLSGIAIGLMMMVNTEGKVGGTDLQNNLAFHAAEGGIEKQASDLAATFTNAQSPTAGEICAVGGPPYGVTANEPALVGVTWTDYSVTPASGCTTNPPTHTWGQITGSGQEAGLWAQIIPINMLATAALPGGQEVSMTRSAQVALIPVFQFGVFCQGDCFFGDSPNLDFAGRVHANGDLYLGVMQGYTLTFHDKMEAYGNIVTETLPNGLTINAGSSQDVGNVYIPTVVGGCTPNTTTNCVLKAANTDPSASPYGDGSVQGAGGNPVASAYNGTNWNTFSKTTTNLMLINGNYGSTTNPGTGAKKLSMPFVSGTTLPNELIRRPQPGDSTALTQSREYNLAQIHVLLSDNPADLPGGAADVNNIRLANVTGSNPYGITMTTGNYLPALGAPPANNTYNLYFAAGSNAVPIPSSCSGNTCTVADWPYAPAAQTQGNPNPSLLPAGAPIDFNNGTPVISLCPPAAVNGSSTPTPTANCPLAQYPYYAPPNPNGANPSNAPNSATWNLIDGWLRVEYVDSSGVWHPVTSEWLNLGFARGIVPPTASGGGTPAGGVQNPINPNAILLLQEPADRPGSLTNPTSTATAPVCTKTVSGVCTKWTAGSPPEVVSDAGSGGEWYFGISPAAPTTQSLTMYNWYPINFYDAREGEPRDIIYNNNSCTTNGVMNAVELDVGNLKRWLAGSIGASGTSVDYVAQNGYVLYFSDRRGMLYNPWAVTANTKTGDAGLEDVVNAGSAPGTPDGALQAPVTASPEDVNLNGHLDNWGEANLGLGFWGTAGNAAKNLNAQITSSAPYDPYGTASTNNRIGSCGTTARKNWVSGARHVLKLVDGSLGNLPLSPNAGGFTVAAENPVYVQGDYNSNAADTFWGGGADVAGHAPASVIADAVTMLSDSWVDQYSMLGNIAAGGNGSPTQPVTNRSASTSWYRLAVAGGKNIAFPFPAWANSTPDYPFGTDGGVHNFLRFLEDWNGPGASLNYGGSMVSLYYATYNTGTFKCCTYSVYLPPTRNYVFDNDFTNPSGLPPGTPLFRDVESLSYRQMFTTRTY